MLPPMNRLAPLPVILACACAPPPPLDAGGTSIEILFPASDESVVYCPELIVVVDVEGFTIDADAVGGENVEGEGHWHLLDSNAHLFTVTEEWVAVDGENALSPGRHFFTAELVNNDHQSLAEPVVSNLVEFNVADQEDCLGGVTMAAADAG